MNVPVLTEEEWAAVEAVVYIAWRDANYPVGPLTGALQKISDRKLP